MTKERKILKYIIFGVAVLLIQSTQINAEEYLSSNNTNVLTENVIDDETVETNAGIQTTSPVTTTIVKEEVVKATVNQVTIKKAPVKVSKRNEIVKYALRFKGNPYVWGGTSLTKGADCSGFTQSVFRNKGIRIPRTSRTQATGGRRVSLRNLKPGDLVFYRNRGRINHVALYIGNGRVISASSRKTGIRISRYNYRKPYKAVTYINE